MTASLPEQSRDLALELHGLLHDIDPSRWKQHQQSEFIARFDALCGHTEQLHALAADDVSQSELAASLSHVLLLMREDLPRTETTGSQPALKRDQKRAWIAFGKEVTAAYEDLALTLKEHDLRVPSLRPTNLVRSAFHVIMATAALATLELTPTWNQLVAAASFFFFTGWTMELTRRRSRRINRFLMRLFGPVAHPHETYRINSSTWYACAILTMALMNMPLASRIGVIVLGLGDPVAALVGRRFGRTKLVDGRSLEGSSAFVLVSGTVATLVSLWLSPTLPVAVVLAASFAGALLGAVAELFSGRLDDNLTVPISATVASALVFYLAGITP